MLVFERPRTYVLANGGCELDDQRFDLGIALGYLGERFLKGSLAA